jgi:hypothetical protein
MPHGKRREADGKIGVMTKKKAKICAFRGGLAWKSSK